MENTILYSKDHIWIRNDKTGVFLGLSNYAVEKLKAIMFLNLPEIGEEICIGKTFGDIESIKAVSELISPVSGVVDMVNETLIDNPDKIAESPDTNWLVHVKNAIVSSELMDSEKYDLCKDGF